MGQTREQKARKIGITFGKGMTKMFQKPYTKGVNFRWSNAPDMFGKHVESLLFIYFTSKPKNMEELKKIAYQSCFEQTKVLIEELNLRDE